MNTNERHLNQRPSARHHDLALVVEDKIMAMLSGLSDEHMNGIDLCTYLAGLVANEKHPVGSTGWQSAYRQTMAALGWQASGMSTLTRREMYGLADLEAVAKRMAVVIGCGATSSLIGQSIASLRNPTPASRLLRASSQVSDRAFALNLLLVPCLNPRGDLQVGIVFVMLHDELTLSGTLPGPSGYPSATDELAKGFSMTLPVGGFGGMMDKLEPRLEAQRQQLWEKIRGGD